MKNKIPEDQALKYQDIKDTYIAFIKENIYLIKQLIDKGNKTSAPYDPNNTGRFFRGKALHLQTMSLIGMSAEHLIKLILAKRGYTLNKVSYTKFNPETKEIDVLYQPSLIGFRESVSLFNQFTPNKYFDSVKPYTMNPYPDVYDAYSYFGRKVINPQKCLNLLVDIRNSYLHYASAQGEQNGIIWYLYNFVVWLAKKEFGKEFSGYKYIGSEEAENLFLN